MKLNYFQIKVRQDADRVPTSASTVKLAAGSMYFVIAGTMALMRDGAVRSPDVTWIEKSKLLDVPAGVKFPQVIPDFVIELRSDTDRMPKLREKMEEYRAAGVRLGLLIVGGASLKETPKSKQVEIYRFEQETSIVESPTEIDCSEVMPGFILNVSEIC